MMEGTCVSGSCQTALGPCGGLGEFECPVNGCTAPYTTGNNGRCVACGGASEICCPSASGDYCGSGYICDAGNCAACGGATQRCCLGNTCRAGACNQGMCP
jgi:hypothetical protein